MTSPPFELKHPAHDNFFKQVMTDPRVVQGFFKMHLPADLAGVMEWESLVPQKVQCPSLRGHIVAVAIQKESLRRYRY